MKEKDAEENGKYSSLWYLKSVCVNFGYITMDCNAKMNTYIK